MKITEIFKKFYSYLTSNKTIREEKQPQPKRSWYNNGKIQKLVSPEDVKKQGKEWTLGRIKKHKGVK